MILSSQKDKIGKVHLSWHDLSLTTLTKCDEELFLAGLIMDLPQAPFIF
jgi:hypothetical protein